MAEDKYTCDTCDGEGSVEIPTAFGTTKVKCDDCAGRGWNY